MVIWDDHEKGEKGLSDGKQVFVGWLPFEGGEGVIGLFEEGGDCVSIFDGIAMMMIKTMELAKAS